MQKSRFRFSFGLFDSVNKSYDVLTPVSYDHIYHISSTILPYCISKVSSRVPNLTFKSDVSPRGLPLRTLSQMAISILRTWSCESCHDASVHDVKKLEAILEESILSASFFSILTGLPVFNMVNCEICSICTFFWAFILPFAPVFNAMDVIPTSRMWKNCWEVSILSKCGGLHVI